MHQIHSNVASVLNMSVTFAAVIHLSLTSNWLGNG